MKRDENINVFIRCYYPLYLKYRLLSAANTKQVWNYLISVPMFREFLEYMVRKLENSTLKTNQTLDSLGVYIFYDVKENELRLKLAFFMQEGESLHSEIFYISFNESCSIDDEEKKRNQAREAILDECDRINAKSTIFFCIMLPVFLIPSVITLIYAFHLSDINLCILGLCLLFPIRFINQLREFTLLHILPKCCKVEFKSSLNNLKHRVMK